jgi:N-succinyldiaminopimelate aminotransferase
MPRFPSTATSTGGIYKSVFAGMADRLAAVPGEVFPLHIGDTYLEPLAALPGLAESALSDRAALARYSHPHGRADLLSAVQARLRSDRLPAADGEVLISSGATHALFCAAASLFETGDEVLVLAPHWPLIPGILRTAGATPVEVPFFDRLGDRLGETADVESLLGPHLTGRTAAIYFNSPNNPTGRTLRARELEALAGFARAQGLWIVADEVYAGFGFGDPVPLIGALPEASDRTLSAFSFSKSYAMAGYRIGYLSGPREVIDAARKVSTHTVYSVSGVGQLLAKRVLEGGEALREKVRASYRAAAQTAAENLRADFRHAEGGAYLFLDLRRYPDPHAVIYRALDRGVALAPGEAFGPSYRGWARLCYSSVPPDKLERGLAVLNAVLTEASR